MSIEETKKEDHSPVRKEWEHRFGVEGYEEVPEGEFINFLDRHQSEIGPKILDNGSGSGRHALELARRGYDVTAFELTTAGLEETKKKFDEAGLKADLVQGNYHQLPFQNDSFDSLVSVQSFQYNDEEGIKKAFAESARVLKKGGLFYLRIRSEKFQAKSTGTHVSTDDENGNIIARGFSLEELGKLAKDNNFEIIDEPVEELKPKRKDPTLVSGQWNIVMRKI